MCRLITKDILFLEVFFFFFVWFVCFHKFSQGYCTVAANFKKKKKTTLNPETHSEQTSLCELIVLLMNTCH